MGNSRCPQRRPCTGRTVMALLAAIPSAALLLLSLTRPLAGDTGRFIDPLLSAVCHRIPASCPSTPWGPSGLCSRCTGFWLGLASGTVLMYYHFHGLPFWTGFPALAPMLADGFLQLHTPYRSSNPARAFTGLAAGLGVSVLLLGRFRFKGQQGGQQRKGA